MQIVDGGLRGSFGASAATTRREGAIGLLGDTWILAGVLGAAFFSQVAADHCERHEGAQNDIRPPMRSLAAPARLSQPLVTPKKFAPRLQICNLAVGQGGFSPPTIRRMPIQLAQAHALVAQFVELQPTPLAHHRKRVVKNVF
ncbi:MAG: hypothetical protein WA159_05295 [Variovorax sp.]